MLIAVTGATGFVGHYLLPILSQRHQVIALTRAKLAPEKIPEVHWLTSVDYMDLNEVLPAGTEALIHLAAVLPSPTSSPELFWYNTQSILHLMQALRQAGGRRFVLASSQMVYGSPCELPVNENEICKPTTPYGLSKLAAEAIAMQQKHFLELEVVCLRLAEIFGFGQHRGYAADVILAKALEGSDVVLFGHYRQLRDLLYVKDAARALSLAVDGQTEGVFNIGADKAHSIQEYAQACIEVLGKGQAKLICEPLKQTDEPSPPDFWMDSGKARKQLGFTAKFDLFAAMQDILRLSNRQ